MLRGEMSSVCECSAFMYAAYFEVLHCITKRESHTQDCTYLTSCEEDTVLMMVVLMSDFVL